MFIPMGKSAAINSISRMAAEFIRRRPAPFLTAVAAIFFFYHTRHLPAKLQFFFLVPLLILDYVLIALSWAFIRRRLAKKSVSLWPEFLAAVAAVGAGLFFSSEREIGTLLFALALLAWLFLQAFFNRIGPFYAMFIGILITGGVFGSYRLLHYEEHAYLYAAFLRQRALALEKIPRVLLGKNKTGNLALRLEFRDGGVLESVPPSDLHYHDPRAGDFNLRVHLAHPLLAVFSSKKKDPFAHPLVALYSLDAKTFLAPGDFRGNMEMMLRHRESAGEIDQIDYGGPWELKPPLSAMPLRGLVWKFREREKNARMRYGFYLLRSYSGKQYVISFLEREIKGFKHHPDLLSFFKTLRWSER